jgi:Xaa-Pro aminopeptidase
MRYKLIDNKLFIENRKKLASKLKPNSVAIFFSNDIMPTNADGHMGFKQNADLFYLSGADQEETILVIAPDAFLPQNREILFVKETSDLIKIWEGEKLSKNDAQHVSGINNIQWISQFDTILKTLLHQSENIYLNSNEHLRALIEVETREVRLNKKIMQEYPLHNFERLAPIMHDLRSIKHPIEINLMQEACNITEKGIRRILKFIRPEVMEFEIEAELIHEFIINRSKGFAYGPIIASGANACVLHYTENNKVCKSGDLVLLDVGAEYANYASDLTRCLPVSGKFSDRQKEVYNSVLHVKNEATKLLKAGTYLNEYHKEVGKLMESELLKLKLIDTTDIKNQNPDWPAYKKYFMHGTSHYLGLDVHDVGPWDKPMQNGMVFTCEPGIYIAEEGIGIRLEDDILITENGPINLMANIPIEANEIEDLMHSK